MLAHTTLVSPWPRFVIAAFKNTVGDCRDGFTGGVPMPAL